MPRAPHLCGTLNCTHLVPHGTRYCPEHGKPAYQQRSRVSERTESARRTGTRRFNQHVRPAVLKRDNFSCQLNIDGVCVSRGEPLPADQLEIDHILEVAYGGSDDLDNLRTVCRPCHRRRGRTPVEEFLAPGSPRPRRKPAPEPQPPQMPRVIFLRP